MLKIKNLKKTYPNGVKALNEICLEIGKGMFGLLGPNGAGKSSLMRTIATLQKPDSGSVHFGEIDVLKDKREMRSLLGYLPQEFGVYPTLSAEAVLNHLAVLKGIVNGRERKEEVGRLLEMTNLTAHRKKHLGGFSGGMKQRFGIAQALLGNPQVIIVDEPTAGLDPSERDRFHNLLSTVGENVTVILSTHIVSDVTQLCSEMAVLYEGNLLAHTSPLKAIEELKGSVWKRIVPKAEIESLSHEVPLLSSRLLHGEGMLRAFSKTKLGSEWKAAEPDLEDVYFALIKNHTRFSE